MPRRMMLTVPAILAILVVAAVVTGRSSRAERAADDCLSKPNSAAPQGNHWYYRLDRAANRRCWYLGPERLKVRQAASPKQPPFPPPRARPAPEAPAPDISGDGANDLVVVSSMHPHGLAKEAGWIERDPALLSTSADARHPQDDTLSIGPILGTADRAATQQPPEFASENTLAFVAGVLALAAIAVRKIHRIFVVWRLRLRRRHLRDRWVATISSRKHDLPAFTGAATAIGQAEIARKPAAAAPAGFARARKAPADSSHDIEKSLQRLLQDWKCRAA